MTLPDQARKDAAILTRAHQAARKVQTEAEAMEWLHEHYYPNIENVDLKDDFDAMHRAIVLRVTGAGGG